jgi:hypothetical protein
MPGYGQGSKWGDMQLSPGRYVQASLPLLTTPACGNRAFKSRDERAKSGLKEQGEKCPKADFLHEAELLSKHNTKVAAATTGNFQMSG